MKAERRNKFLEIANTLKSKGVSFKAMAKAIDIDEIRMKNIRSGNSSPEEKEIRDLETAFSSILLEAGVSSDYQSEDDEKDKEIERLKKLIIEQRSRIDKMIDLLYDKEKGKNE